MKCPYVRLDEDPSLVHIRNDWGDQTWCGYYLLKRTGNAISVMQPVATEVDDPPSCLWCVVIGAEAT